jgi:two-component system, NarL family, response regulator LiaR
MHAMTQQIRVIVADDHEIVRRGVREYLVGEPDMQVVGEARNGADALHLVDELRPDVLVVDIQMPEVSGVEVTTRVKQQHPECQVLVLTAFDNDPYIFALLKAGASGYLLKTAGPDDLVRAVRVVHEGQSWLGPEVAKRVLAGLAGGRLVDTGAEAQAALSEREMDVLRLMARGLPNGAIAEQLVVSERTIHGHLANILRKLEATNRTEAVLKAMRLGLVNLSDLAE